MVKGKNINALIVIPLLLTFVLVGGVTLALFSKKVETNKKISITTGTKYIGIYGENKNNIGLNQTYTFTIENRGVEDAGYYLYIDDIESTDLSNISYTITKNNNSITQKMSEEPSNRKIDIGNLLVGEKTIITLNLTGNDDSNYLGKLRIKTVDYIKPTTPVITGESSNYQTSTTITVSTASISPNGIKTYQYYLSSSSTEQMNGNWIDCETNIIIETEGTHYIYFRAVDNNGRKSDISNSLIVKIDNTVPILDMAASGDYIINDGKNISSSSFGLSGGVVTCITNPGNYSVTNFSNMPLGTYDVICTATSNTGVKSIKKETYSISGNFNATTSIGLSAEGGYKSGADIILPTNGTQYGPYIKASTGTYWVYINGNNFTCDNCMVNDVYQNDPWIRYTILDRNCTSNQVTFSFTVNEDAFGSGIEVVTRNYCDFDMTINNIRIEKH